MERISKVLARQTETVLIWKFSLVFTLVFHELIDLNVMGDRVSPDSFTQLFAPVGQVHALKRCQVVFQAYPAIGKIVLNIVSDKEKIPATDTPILGETAPFPNRFEFAPHPITPVE